MAESTRVIEHPERHEASDISLRPLIIFGIGVLILGVIIELLMYGLFGSFEKSARKEDAPRTATSAARSLAPEPRLQGVPGFHANLPSQDLQQMHLNEQRILNSYGKTSEDGFVRIPIDRAMQLLVEQNGNQPKGGGNNAH